MMSLLKSVVFADVMQVISSKCNGISHLGRKNDTLEDSASDRNIGGEWAFVVDVLSLNCGLWSFETKTNFLVVSRTSGVFLSKSLLVVLENSNLLLESFFVLK